MGDQVLCVLEKLEDDSVLNVLASGADIHHSFVRTTAYWQLLGASVNYLSSMNPLLVSCDVLSKS